MGRSILSAIADDEDDYISLCSRYNEKPQDLYSVHYDWINDLHDGKTQLPYDKYLKISSKKTLKRKIELKEDEIKRLKKEIKDLKGLASII